MEKYEISPEEKEALSITREQVKNGQYLNQKEVDEEIKKIIFLGELKLQAFIV